MAEKAKGKDAAKEPEGGDSLDQILSDLPDQIKTQVDEALDARIEELRTEYRKQADETLTKVTGKLEDAIENEVDEKVKAAVSELRFNAPDGEEWAPDGPQLPAVGEPITYVVVDDNTGHEEQFAAQVTAVGNDGTTITLVYFAPNARAGRSVQIVPFGPGEDEEERKFFWRYPELSEAQIESLASSQDQNQS